jgi:hypothetical protein
MPANQSPPAAISRLDSTYSTDTDKPHDAFIEDKNRMEPVLEADEDHIGEAQYIAARDGQPIVGQHSMTTGLKLI